MYLLLQFFLLMSELEYSRLETKLFFQIKVFFGLREKYYSVVFDIIYIIFRVNQSLMQHINRCGMICQLIKLKLYHL